MSEEASATVVESPSADTPAQTDAPTTSDQGGNEVTPQATSQKSENRYQKLASENKRYREENESFKSQMAALENAKKIDAWLRQDPRNVKRFMELMDQKPQQEKDPYAEFHPDVAERFRKYDALINKYEEGERRQKESEARSVEENKTYLEGVYMKKLKDDGFINKDGTYDESEVDLLSDAVLSRATRIAKDPYKITEKELIDAYDQIIKGTRSLEKRGLTRKVTPTPPPSGTKTGSVPATNKKMTDEERVMAIAKEL